MQTRGKVILSLLVIIAVAFSVWRWYPKLFPEKKNELQGVDTKAVKASLAASTVTPAASAATGNKEPAKVLPALLAGDKEAKLIGNSVLPAVTGISDYTKSMKNGRVLVKFPINVWPGWAPIIVANNGMEPNDDSIFFKEYGFYLELSIVDDPVRARDLYASGHTHVLWGTLDMFALYAPELCKDPRISPRIPMQIDFSAGGDGIVVRNNIRSINDLGVLNSGQKNKVLLAQNSTSQYFLMYLLIEGTVDLNCIEFCYTADAPSAAKLFVNDKSYSAFVGWSPDIYNVSEYDQNSRVMLTTSRANQVVADVWGVRGDFNRDHPDIVIGLVEGILKGTEEVRRNPAKAADALSKAFSIPVADCEAMIGKDGGISTGDAHLVNYRENEKFFMSPNNPNNFEAIWTRASKIYKALGYIQQEVSVSVVKETAPLMKIANNWCDSTDLSQKVFNFKDKFANLENSDNQVLVKTVRIQFRPGKWDLDSTYDTKLAASMEEIGQLAGAFGSAAIVIEGHADASNKGTVPEDLVNELSFNRAKSVTDALVEKYKFNPKQFKIVGKGWSVPLPGTENQSDSDEGKANRKLNRRVEIKVYPLESE